ncbi:hypothetical protein MGSAQ_002255 [marine sediment metagenome]|uniref:Uncharacterized protein n=1 Tax=marine sediment metagenome TaxID=412755 RepID=A0A1B6NS19_9ZZZZ
MQIRKICADCTRKTTTFAHLFFDGNEFYWFSNTCSTNNQPRCT